MRESCYWQQTWPPPREPRASLTTSLLPAMQHLFVNRSSIINRLMWISNLLRRLTWQTRPEAPYLSVPHPRAQAREPAFPRLLLLFHLMSEPGACPIVRSLVCLYTLRTHAGLYRSPCCFTQLPQRSFFPLLFSSSSPFFVSLLLAKITTLWVEGK